MSKRSYSVLFTLLLIFTGSACKKKDTLTFQYWTENIGSNKSLPLLPDSNVNYFLYSFTRHPGERTGIRIKGQYGYARYMSYNVYNNANISSVASIVDMQIEPDSGNGNPFLPSVTADITSRNYTVNICPNSITLAAMPNLLLYDDKIENVGIILRYYIPQNNNYANVPLPQIEAFDIETGAALNTPVPYVTNFDSQFKQKYQRISTLLNLAGLLEAPKDVFFYKFSGVFLYPNLDNYYLFTPVTFNKNQVIMLRFKAPTFAAGNTQNGLTDVRYFSICLNDSKTYTYSTTTDLAFHAAASDGFINIVIGDEDAALRAKAAGLNYIVLPPELKNNVKGLIIYRNLLTNLSFQYSMNLVPDVSANINLPNLLNLSNIQAQTYMADYAPVARKMTTQQFLSNFDGFPVSY
jgi:hypothetical protein